MSGAVLPPCFLTWDLKLSSKGLVQAVLCSVPLTPQHAIVNPRFRQRLLDTHRQVWVSLLCGHCFFLLAPGAHKVLFVPSKSLFPQSCGSSTIKSQWPPNSHFLRVLSPFARSPGWAICCVSRAFLTVQEFIWYNFCAVCGSSTQQLYGRANGDLLQEGLCHTIWPRCAAARAPVPTAGHCWPMPLQETLKYSKGGLAQFLWGHWVLLHTHKTLCALGPRKLCKLNG